MSGFSFGQSSSGAPSGSLFDSSGLTGSAGGGLFEGKSDFSFGGLGQSSTSNAPEPKSLFGATTDNKSSGNIFGQTPSSGTTSGSAPALNFPKNADDGKSSSGPIFGTPKAPTPSFGSATPAPASSQPQWSFPNPSTTPAGPPPAASQFGASTGGASNIFGGNKSSQENTSKTPALNFGSQLSQTGGSVAPSPFAAKPADKPADSSTAAPTGQKPFFSFNPSPTPASPATSGAPTPSFGAATAKPTANTTLFGVPPASSQPAASTPLFGAPPTSSQPTVSQASNSLLSKPSTSSTESAPNPAFSFPATSAQSQSSTPATISEASKPLFGALGGAPTSAAPRNPLFGASTSSATPASTSTAPTISATATTSSAPVFSLAPATVSTTHAPATIGGLAASTSGPLPPAQSRLKNKTMDEILTRWANDLTKYSKEFKSHGETVAKWDQVIVDNSSKIDKLYVKTRTCEKQTMSVEMQLSAVENQQNELETWLTKYENDVEAMLSKEGATPNELGGPDQERERTYRLAERLSEKVDEMERDLSSMVDEVNAANASLSKNGKADEPITQIVRILNSHLSQLQAIDQGTAALQARVSEAQKAANGLGYLNSGANGDGRAAVDDFYRSYIGRR